MTNALHSTVYSRKQWEFAYICHDRLLVAAFVAVLDNCDSQWHLHCSIHIYVIKSIIYPSKSFTL